MKQEIKLRIKNSIKEILPTTTKTCIWILKITVAVSFAMLLLKYFNILPWIAQAVSPLFKYLGLPGEAALAYVSGYFVNVYSAIAVISTLNLDVRALTILCTMVLCSHSMILETAVLKKTGCSGIRMVIVRTVVAIFMGVILNLILPKGSVESVIQTTVQSEISFWPMLWDWFLSTLKLVVQMVVIIYSLNIIQRLLTEFGVMAHLARFLKPLMLFFGLPAKTAFLWIVANIIGLGYGAAAMLDETARGELEKRDVQLIGSHICVAHSNLEDLLLLTALGATWWIMLLIRWAMAIVLVWEMRLEFYIKERFLEKKSNFAS